MVTSYWDHSTKPSTFVVKYDNKEIYKGPFKEGYEVYTKAFQTNYFPLSSTDLI
jgi:hypothetical protein